MGCINSYFNEGIFDVSEFDFECPGEHLPTAIAVSTSEMIKPTVSATSEF